MGPVKGLNWGRFLEYFSFDGGNRAGDSPPGLVAIGGDYHFIQGRSNIRTQNYIDVVSVSYDYLLGL